MENKNKARFIPGSIKDLVSRRTSPEEMFQLGILFESLARSGDLVNPSDALDHANNLLNVASAVSIGQRST